MHKQATRSGTTVFIKTAKGRDEITSRRNKLGPRERRLLIVIDGSKDLDTLTAMSSAMVPQAELEQTFSFLLQQEFITALQEAAEQQLPATLKKAAGPEHGPVALHLVASVAQQATEVQPENALQLTQDPVVIRQVKDFMTTTTQTYLGLLGASVIQRIERAKDAAQLMAVLGHWHMALHDSKHGSRFAAPYLEQVQQSLTGMEAERKQA